jgi:hypothetical protein
MFFEKLICPDSLRRSKSLLGIDVKTAIEVNKSNIRSRMEAILVILPEPPHSFKDALLATRALGIRYLWIDSLCIVQDDESD